MAVSGRRARSVQSPGRGLVHAAAEAFRFGAESTADGRMAAQTERGGPDPLRPGHSVHQRRLAEFSEGSQIGVQYEAVAATVMTMPWPRAFFNY